MKTLRFSVTYFVTKNVSYCTVLNTVTEMPYYELRKQNTFIDLNSKKGRYSERLKNKDFIFISLKRDKFHFIYLS